MIKGRPAVCYQVDGSELLFTRADDADGLFWSAAPVPVATGVGASNSLTVIAGYPAIACAGSPNYYRALDPLGSAWGPAVPVAQATASSLVSLQLVGWRPAMLYYDESGSGGIKYVRALDATGSAWGTPVSIFGGGIGRCARFGFAVINGMPAVTYPDASSWPEKLIYQRALDVNGQAWSPPVVVGSQWGIGGASSIVCVEGNPAIAYDVPNGFCSANIAYVRAADSLGSAWGEPVVVHVGQDGAVGYPSEAIVVDGHPAVFGWEGTEVFFVESEDAVGTSWGKRRLVDYEYEVYGLSAAVVNGHPAISYYAYDGSAAELRYAVYMPE